MFLFCKQQVVQLLCLLSHQPQSSRRLISICGLFDIKEHYYYYNDDDVRKIKINRSLECKGNRDENYCCCCY